MSKPRVLGMGNAGKSHALAYTRIDGFEVVGARARHIDKIDKPVALKGAQRTALAELKPDAVSTNQPHSIVPVMSMAAQSSM